MPASTRGVDLAYRVTGTVVGLALGALTGLWEALLTPMYAHIGHTYFRLPLAALLAVLTNVGLVWFTHRVTERTGLALLPGVAWFGILLVAAAKTSEGDLLIVGTNWAGLLTILLGSIAWAGAAYRLIVKPLPRTPPTPRGRPSADV